ncbi:MAG TPA: hypothetical protein PLL71_09190 [Agriterribacter sp.]|nr:hypothetical protein [Agriterribacter sp.]
MITTTSLYDQFVTLYRERETGQDNNWLKALRDNAFEAFSGRGFPTLKLEEWRFTNVF